MMTSCLWILLLASLVGVKTQDFDLSDALDGVPTPAPPKKDPKPPKTGDGELDLFDALDPDIPSEPKKPAVNPDKTKGGGDFNIFDAVDPKKPAPPKSGGGGGGDLSDSDLSDVAEDDTYKPEPGKGGRSGGRASSNDATGGEGDQAQDFTQQWMLILKLLGDNIPEGLHAWIANSKHVVLALIEKVLELLDLGEGEKQS